MNAGVPVSATDNGASRPAQFSVDLPDLSATAALAGRIAGLLRAGDVIALSGDLGTGKTTLARMIIKALGYAGEVPSPSFTILETYDPPALSIRVVHADFYRLENPAEAEELGLDDYRDGAAMLAEWPEKAGHFLHEDCCLHIMLTLSDKGRSALVGLGKGWQSRWI